MKNRLHGSAHRRARRVRGYAGRCGTLGTVWIPRQHCKKPATVDVDGTQSETRIGTRPLPPGPAPYPVGHPAGGCEVLCRSEGQTAHRCRRRTDVRACAAQEVARSIRVAAKNAWEANKVPCWPGVRANRSPVKGICCTTQSSRSAIQAQSEGLRLERIHRNDSPGSSAHAAQTRCMGSAKCE